MNDSPALLHTPVPHTADAPRDAASARLWAIAPLALAVAILLVLAFANLTRWPVIWFDEGSHLHVPKTLVQDGVYADKSSEGYRYFGPTTGVGPTVMLPIALAFRVAGVGLLQARMVMALYLLGAVLAFAALARQMGGRRFVWIAVALLVATRGVALFEYGRQLLGEVPGLCFLAAGLALWFDAWRRGSPWARLAAAGLLIGLSLVTKTQNLLIVAPALLLAFAANIVHYRAVPARAFLITGTVAAVTAAAWQAYQVLYQGPATAAENFALLRAASAGAAFVFDPALMRRSVGELLSPKVYFSLLPIIVGFGILRALPRSSEGLRWGTLAAFVLVNLVWYVFGSISWLRYAFLALALSALVAARLLEDLLALAPWQPRAWLRGVWQGKSLAAGQALAALGGGLLAALIVLPLLLTVRSVFLPPPDDAGAMAAYLNAHVAQDALIETWEPELGFLTDHNYHFPPNALLNKAVGAIWLGGDSPAAQYSFVQDEHPPYVIVGSFGRWVNLYTAALNDGRYQMERAFGPYELYQAVSKTPSESESSQ